MGTKFKIVASASLMAGSIVGVIEALSILVGAGAGEYDALFWGVLGYSLLCICGTPISFLAGVLLPVDRVTLWLSVFFGLCGFLGFWIFAPSLLQLIGLLLLFSLCFWFGKIILLRTPLKILLTLKGGTGIFLLLLLIVGIFSLTPGRNIYAPPVHALSANGKPNVLILLVDGLRKDYLRLGMSPAIDSFAQRSVQFEHAFANAPDSFSSVAQMLSGGVSQNSQILSEQVLPDKVVSLAEHFAYHGYQTFALVNKPELGRFSNLHQGFDHYRYLPPRSNLPFNEGTRRLKLFQTIFAYQAEVLVDPNRLYRPARDVFFQFQQETRHNVRRESPWFAILQISELTPPFFVQRSDGQYTDVLFPQQSEPQDLQRVYVDNLRKLDHDISRLLLYLKQARLHENTIIILTASHSTSLSKNHPHHPMGVQIPLLIHSPKIPPKRIRQDVQLSDIPMTLSALVSIPPDPSWKGEMIFRLPPREHVRPIRASFQDRERGWELLQQGDWRYIRHHDLHQKEELYDLSADPFQETNVIGEHPEQKQKMRQFLEQDLKDQERNRRGH